MSKLSFKALEARASEVISQELLNSISGGNENACHDSPIEPPIDNSNSCEQCEELDENNHVPVPNGNWIIHLINH